MPQFPLKAPSNKALRFRKRMAAYLLLGERKQKPGDENVDEPPDIGHVVHSKNAPYVTFENLWIILPNVGRENADSLPHPGALSMRKGIRSVLVNGGRFGSCITNDAFEQRLARLASEIGNERTHYPTNSSVGFQVLLALDAYIAFNFAEWPENAKSFDLKVLLYS
jgi:hypothetical protein